MNAYKYEAISKDGAPVNGVIEAYDEFEAVALIKENCKLVTKIDPIVTKEKLGGKDLTEPVWVSDKTLSLAASQFSILLRAGLPAARTVEVVAQQTTDKLLKRILTKVADDVAAGYSLSRSLEARGPQIPMTFIETVRAGEESGTLETSFDRLQVYYENSHKIRGKVKSAMAYPIFLVLISVIVIMVVMNVTVPVVSNIIEGNGGTLPIPTKMMIGIYNFFKHYWWMAITWILGIAVAFMLYKRSDKGRIRCADLATRLPLLGKLTRMKAASQFANTMATLLSAGLPVAQAISITGRILDNAAIGALVGAGSAGIEEGKTLGFVLRQNPYLDPLLIEMTAVGEESGALEHTLDTIGQYFDSETEQASARALAMMEPALTVILGVIIGFIVISLYLPMFSMYDNM